MTRIDRLMSVHTIGFGVCAYSTFRRKVGITIVLVKISSKLNTFIRTYFKLLQFHTLSNTNMFSEQFPLATS